MSRVVITGAAGALGPHVARRLADGGHELVLCDVDEAKLRPLAQELGARGDVVDLLDEDAVRAWAADLGDVDAVLHLVGGWRGGAPIEEAPLDDWRLLHDLLVRTTQHVSRAFTPALAASPRGRFAIIGAKQAVAPSHTNAAYAAAKAAAEAWTFALADRFADVDATANVVAINALVTPEQRAAEPEKAFRTFTDAEQVAGTLAWLLSDDAAKVNGQRIALYAA